MAEVYRARIADEPERRCVEGPSLQLAIDRGAQHAQRSTDVEAGQIGTVLAERRRNTMCIDSSDAAQYVGVLELFVDGPSSSSGTRAAHLAALAFVGITSAMVQANHDHQGVLQRALWTGGLTWMVLTHDF